MAPGGLAGSRLTPEQDGYQCGATIGRPSEAWRRGDTAQSASYPFLREANQFANASGKAIRPSDEQIILGVRQEIDQSVARRLNLVGVNGRDASDDQDRLTRRSTADDGIVTPSSFEVSLRRVGAG